MERMAEATAQGRGRGADRAPDRTTQRRSAGPYAGASAQLAGVMQPYPEWRELSTPPEAFGTA